MSKQLVFVHGRAQENKDSIALKAEWIEAFNEGLKNASHEFKPPGAPRKRAWIFG